MFQLIFHSMSYVSLLMKIKNPQNIRALWKCAIFLLRKWKFCIFDVSQSREGLGLSRSTHFLSRTRRFTPVFRFWKKSPFKMSSIFYILVNASAPWGCCDESVWWFWCRCTIRKTLCGHWIDVFLPCSGETRILEVGYLVDQQTGLIGFTWNVF